MTRTKTTYRVWRPQNDETIENGQNFDAHTAEGAAEAAAAQWHGSRDGWEWQWPQMFRVRSDHYDATYDVEVDRRLDPSFEAAGAKVVS